MSPDASNRTQEPERVNIAAMLTKAAGRFAERPALALGSEVVMDFRAFAERAGALAGHLSGQYKLAQGERVAIAMSNHPDFMVVLYACWIAGLVAVPINAKLHRREFAYILEDCGARLVFTNAKTAQTLDGLEQEIAELDSAINTTEAGFTTLLQGDPAPLAEVSPDDAAWLFYTSGTTGKPKGAILTHRNLVAMVVNHLADIDAVSEFDCLIHAAPMSHGSGTLGLSHVARGSLQVIPESGGFDPAETVQLVAHYPGACFFFAPTMLVRLMASPALDGADMSNLKTIVYGGGPMYTADLLAALDRLGNKFVQIYGQGEAPMTITGTSRAVHMDKDHPRYLERLGSVGSVRTDVEVKVFDADDNELPVGEIGEVVLRGDVVMKGYWNNPEATAKALAGGWLHTGDMGAFDDDGFLTLKDRSKDMIISGGSNIYPREIEEVLLTHDGVAEVSVVGKPHPDWGEEVVAFVVLGPGSRASEADLDALCLDNIARFKRPKRYRFVTALPKNNTGKVLKTVLREQLAQEEDAVAGAA